MWKIMPSFPIPNTCRNLVMMSMILLLSPLTHSWCLLCWKKYKIKKLSFSQWVPLPCLSSKDGNPLSPSPKCQNNRKILYVYFQMSPQSVCFLLSYCITLASDIISQFGIKDLYNSSFQASLYTAAKFISLECKFYRVKLLFHSWFPTTHSIKAELLHMV